MTKHITWKKIKADTKSVWGGETESFPEGATQTPTVNSVAYAYKNLDEWEKVSKGEKPGHIYGRNTNPTLTVLEEKIRILEGAEAATSFSSGMAAISNILFANLKPGDTVVAGKDTYGGTSKIFLEFLPKFNIRVELCDTTDHKLIEEKINDSCQLLYLETPTNPTLKIQNIKWLSKVAKKVNALVVVDNTLATPINQNPLSLGADLVIHSATKFLCGHSDALGGLVCGNKDNIDRIFHFREINGATLAPNAAYLILRGMKTLGLRMERHNSNALKLAKWLYNHSKVDQVYYPGLETNFGHDIALTQMKGFGGVLSFTLKGEKNLIPSFISKLTFAHAAAHLGSVETIVGPPKTTSHVENTAEERALLGIPENMIRCSVGIENIDDIIEDFRLTLESL
jgi:cystathionine gamma-synthase